MEEHQANGNETGVVYEVGRLVRILIIDIDPIEVESLTINPYDEDFDEEETSAFLEDLDDDYELEDLSFR